MSKRRPPKKSETIEVRLEHEVKTRLMRKAEQQGRSASEVVRSFIASYLAEEPKEARAMFATVWKPAAALGAASIGILWSVLAPAPVSAAPDLRAAFAEFDRNGDKAITLDEFLRRSVDTLYVMRADRPPAGHAKAMVVPLSKELVPPPAGARAAPEEMLRSEFARHDRDGDGSVRFEEFEAHHRAMIRAGFDAVDRNKDGSIDAGEFEAMTAAAPEEPAHATFDDLDGNKDGRISEDEFFG